MLTFKKKNFSQAYLIWASKLDVPKIDILFCKSMDWFLYDRDLRHERVNDYLLIFSVNSNLSCSVVVSS